MIIVGSTREFSINKIVTIPVLSDDEGIDHFNVRAYIKREATKQDYIKYCKEVNALIPHLNRLDWPDTKFYEISID